MHLSKKAEDIERMREPNSSLFSILWGNIMEPKLCYIKEEYFAERKHFVKMLDTGNTLKFM